MNHFLTRFRNRLALAFSSALLLIGLPAYLYIQHVYGEQLLADRGHALHRLAESAADLLAENLRERQREITLLARSPVLVAGQFERRDLAQFINTVQASYPQYAWIGLASPTGSVRAASGGLLLNADVAQRPWFKAGINGPFVGDLHEAVLLSKLLPPQKDGAPLRFLDFAAPVPGPDGRPLGVLAAHAYWSWAEEVLHIVRAETLKQSDIQLFIVSPTGQIMFPQAGAPNQRTWADRPIAGPFQIQTGTDGLDYALASSPVREPLPNSTLGWHVVVRQPLDRMLADKATLERDLLVFALLAALLMTGLIWWVATRLGRPIHDLTCYVREVREGNAVPPPFAGGGASEVNALIADTVAMTQTLLDQKQALVHSADRLTQEVNERRAAEQQAKAHAEKLRLAIDAAHLGVWEWRAGEKEVTWSDTCLSHFGQPPGTRVTFAEWRALVHPEDWPRIEAAIAESVAKCCDYSEDYRVTWPDGTEHWIRAIGRPFYDETGRAERMAGVIQEVTARKHHALQIELLNRQLARRALDAETANRAKEAFLRAVSHELRTPLNHIMGGLDILLRSQPDAKQEKWLTTVKASSKDLLGLINSILDATYLAAGQAELESEPFSPATVMQEVCLMLAPRAEAKGLDLTVKPNPELPDEVRGDPARLAQALYNYVDNGIKFTERGSVTLWTQTVLSDDRKGILIQFAVSDTGIGVDARQRENLFSSFTQGDGSTTRKYGGLGIGLANTQSLAKLMGGEVGMDSDPGRGSTFWFTARLKPANGTGE